MKALSSQQLAWAHARWCEGYSIAQISEAFGVCDKTVSRAFHDKGLRKKRPALVVPAEISRKAEI